MVLPLRLRSCVVPPYRGTAGAVVLSIDRPVSGQLTAQSRHAHNHGFTLYESLITLVIASILLVTAVGFVGFVQNNQLVSHANALVGDLSLARSEAIKRGQSIAICKSADGESCAAGAEWHDGWLMFTDGNESGTLDDGEQVIRVTQGLPGRLTVTYAAFGPGIGKYVIYRSTGSTKEQNGTFRFCDAGGRATPRAVIIYKTGRVRASTKNAEGNPITCP